MAGAEGAVERTQADVKDVTPVAWNVKKWKLMGRGALGVVGVGGVAQGVTLARLFDQLLRFVMATG